MVKHMIIWKMNDEVADKTAKAAEIKAALEGLVGKIDGLLSMQILTDGMACSSGDLMMDSSFSDAEELAAYQTHPLHQAVANGIVCPAVSQRLSFDYFV